MRSFVQHLSNRGTRGYDVDFRIRPDLGALLISLVVPRDVFIDTFK